MEEITLKSWEEFENKVEEINNETKELKKNPQKIGSVSYPLFRGVSNSEYHLESTLDRIKKEISINCYNRIIKIARKHIETCTAKKWELSENIYFERKLESRDYEFMAYIRQNGFPSPLIDWTRSPYIAAFFAFRNILSKQSQKDYVSIFVYREYCGEGKCWSGQKPHIHRIGPSIATDNKHYLQQSEYTFCIKENNDGDIIFVSHEDITPYKIGNIVAQDFLVKYNIPVLEQYKVLKKLDVMNITAYSLFKTETSLMETLALRELIFEMKKWQ